LAGSCIRGIIRRAVKGGNVEADLSGLVYFVILAILLAKLFGAGTCGGGPCG